MRASVKVIVYFEIAGQKMTYAGNGASHEDQTTEVSSTGVGESASGVHQSTNAICLDGAADEGRAQAAAAPAASLDLRNSSLELAAWARW